MDLGSYGERRRGRIRRSDTHSERARLRRAVSAIFSASQGRSNSRGSHGFTWRQNQSPRGRACGIRRTRARYLSFGLAIGVRRSRADRVDWWRTSDGSSRGRRAIARRTQSGGRSILARPLRLGGDTAVSKTMTTLNIPAPARSESPRQAQWKEARSVFPIYLALAKQLALEVPFTQAKRNLPEKPDLETFSSVHEWLDSMDQRVMVHQLRHLLQMTTLNASETGLRALIQRHLRKPKKSNVDRDKIDFLLRRTLIELMHADLIAIRAGLAHLQSASVRIIDCHHVGLSSSESLAKISAMADEWKQPFQKEYTERSVSQAFDKLLGLRTDVELALEKALGKPADAAPQQLSALAKPPAGAKRLAGQSPSPNAKGKTKERPATPAVVEADEAVVLDFENCMEQIWEQLIATPPSRGRSMTTVKIGGARILMSSWEVTAFVSEDGPSAEDLRRAVVARVLVTAAMESAKETGNATSLDRAMNTARVEVTRLQERVDVAKQAKDTEAAVNLGISTKRLLSALDEAEKL